MKICYDTLEGLFLSNRCNFRKNKRTYHINTCSACKEEYLESNSSEYCSISCHNTGRIYSKETRAKIGISSKHRNVGKNNGRYDPNLTDEDRLYTRNLPGYKEWRSAVYTRDNYTCQCCGDNTGGNLEAHHKYSYNKYLELRIVLENGITMCKSCHSKFHNEFGRGNNTKEQLYYWLLKNKEEVT